MKKRPADHADYADKRQFGRFFYAMRPNLHVVARANMKQIYDHFSASLKAQYATVSGGIDGGLETLKANNVIKIDVKNYLDEKDKAEKEKWAMEFFKSELLDKFFTPTLNPDDMLKRMADAEPLDVVIDRATGVRRVSDDDPDDPDDDEEEEDTDADGADDDNEANVEKPQNDKDPPKDSPKDGTETPKDGTDTPKDGVDTPKDGTDKPKDGGGGKSGGVLPIKELKNALLSEVTGMPVVSFQLRILKQIEDKELVFEYNRASATKRQYRPQESFGLMYEDLKKDLESSTVDPESKLPTKYFVSVDLDHPFFREFAVRVETISDESFDNYGLRSAIASLEYGTNPRDLKPDELPFEREGEKSAVFKTFLNDKFELDYKHAVTFNKWENVDCILVKLKYSDPENKLEKSAEFMFDKDNAGEKQWYVMVEDSGKKTY